MTISNWLIQRIISDAALAGFVLIRAIDLLRESH